MPLFHVSNKFQSLIGIIWNCNRLPRLMEAIAFGCVSIPNRDYLELQLSSHSLLPSVLKFQSLIGIIWNCNIILLPFSRGSPVVSIPNRDYLELQFDGHRQVDIKSQRFQSLIGIIWNCNSSYLQSYYQLGCFNP